MGYFNEHAQTHMQTFQHSKHPDPCTLFEEVSSVFSHLFYQHTILHLPFFPPSKFCTMIEFSVANVCAACIRGNT
jgi:hypothetical protein